MEESNLHRAIITLNALQNQKDLDKEQFNLKFDLEV